MKNTNGTRDGLQRYTISIAASFVAVLLTLAVDDPLVQPNTRLLFFAAVVISSWQGGFGPGLLATLITASSVAYFYLSQDRFTVVHDPTAAFQLVEYLAVSLLINILSEVRRRAQRRAEAARAEAEAANESKDAFLASVSHDLRTPLSAIIGWAQLLRKERVEPSTIIEGLRVIERNADLQSRLVEDLLDSSRIVAGKLRLDLGRINLGALITEAIDTLRYSIDAKQLDLLTDIENEPTWIVGDEHRLQRVFWNLLSNAIKFTPREGSIEVVLRRVDGQAQITISDTGKGIEQQFLPYIFERFRQASDANRGNQDGLGLGLAIVRELIELHGGAVEAESKGPDMGARFTVRLPLSKGPDE
jgi:signal transduction histidine kinase